MCFLVSSWRCSAYVIEIYLEAAFCRALYGLFGPNVLTASTASKRQNIRDGRRVNPSCFWRGISAAGRIPSAAEAKEAVSRFGFRARATRRRPHVRRDSRNALVAEGSARKRNPRGHLIALTCRLRPLRTRTWTFTRSHTHIHAHTRMTNQSAQDNTVSCQVAFVR